MVHIVDAYLVRRVEFIGEQYEKDIFWGLWPVGHTPSFLPPWLLHSLVESSVERREEKQVSTAHILYKKLSTKGWFGAFLLLYSAGRYQVSSCSSASLFISFHSIVLFSFAKEKCHHRVLLLHRPHQRGFNISININTQQAHLRINAP